MNKSQQIRVRFAPSPTGHLHIGGLRTAFFNWLFARHHNGAFLFRSEDTDLERSKQEYLDSQLAACKWVGIEPDEPVVIQSHRFPEHEAILKQLLAEGKAYRCYCPAQKTASVDGQFAKYDKSCRIRLPESDLSKQHVIRFAVPDATTQVAWHDLIRGDVSVSVDEIDDFIIARSDGRPVYNYVVVLDDAFMRITHVIRADEHISNTPKQILLYQALNYTVPQFAHAPLILGPTGAPLSKRDAATNVVDYRENGYLPDALLNYLVRLGWSHGDQEIFSIAQMIELFSLEQVGKKGAIFDQTKLDWINSVYMRQADEKMLVAYMSMNLAPDLIQRLEQWPAPSLLTLIRLYKERTKTVKELAQELIALHEAPTSYLPEDVAKWTDPSTASYLNELVQILEALPDFTVEMLTEAINNFCKKADLKLVKIAQPIRLALVGKASSPGVFELLSLIGKAESCARLRTFAAAVTART